jgi:hypothetical protein
MGACVSAEVSVGMMVEMRMRMRNAKCEMRNANAQKAAAIGGLRGGGGGACACESAKRHANAACESGHAKRHADAKGACRMRRVHDGKAVEEGTHVQAAFRVEIEIPAVPCVLTEVFSFRKKKFKYIFFLICGF